MKFVVKYQFQNQNGEWVNDTLTNNEKGFNHDDAKFVAYQLRVGTVCPIKNVEIVNMN